MVRLDERQLHLYRRYGGAIYSRCYFILNSKDAAEHATPEVFGLVYKQLAIAPNPEVALRWIDQVATDYCLNEVQRQPQCPTVLATLGVSRRSLLGAASAFVKNTEKLALGRVE
jgi:hypothetical protein